jgi:hypothetical protein
MLAFGKLKNFVAGLFLSVCAAACASCSGPSTNTPQPHTDRRSADYVNSKLFSVIPNTNPSDELRRRIERGDNKVDLAKTFWSEGTNEIDLNVLSSPQARKNVRVLLANQLGLTDTKLAPIHQLQLVELDLSNNKLQNLNALADMKSLKTLLLTNCPLTSRAIAVIAELPDLEELTLNGTPLNDSDLLMLVRCKHLQDLSVIACPHITKAGISRFAGLMPNCSVHNIWGQGRVMVKVPLYLVQQKMVCGQSAEADAMLLKFMHEAKPKTSYDWSDIVQLLEMRAACQLDLGHKEAADKLFEQAISTCHTHCPLSSGAQLKRIEQIRRTAFGRK